MKKFEALFEEIKKSNTILITSHTNPDGDCVASMLALGIMLESLGKQFEIFHKDQFPSCLNFLPQIHRIKISDFPIGKFDLTIAVDTPSLERLCYKYHPDRMGKLVVIDHHLTNDGFGDLNFIFKNIGSACEIIYDFFKEISFPLTVDLANLIFTGIATDTGYFQYRAASAETFRIASELIETGAEHTRIYEEIWKNKEFEHSKVISKILLSTDVIKKLKLGWVKVKNDMLNGIELDENQFSDIVNQVTSIRGIRVAVLLREVKEGTVCEFRSRSDFPVYKVAQYFGGGGHFYASGCTVPYSVDKAEKIVIAKIKEMIIEFNLSGDVTLEDRDTASGTMCKAR